MTQPIAGTGTQAGNASNQQAVPGSLFGVPKYSTQRRFIPDNGNQSLAATPISASQVNVPTTRLDQLDVVRGIKIAAQYGGTWTNTGTGLVTSPFFPANIFQQITFKLQAAYNSFNLTGPLASIIQAYRPMWGNAQLGGTANGDSFAKPGANNPTYGSAYTQNVNIDIPLAFKFDEYFDLTAQGDPTRKVYDAIVSPYYMAAQARVVVPTITIAPQLTTGDLLGGPVSRPGSDTTSTYTAGSLALQISRDAWWTSNNAASNPPQYPWIYTRDYFTQPTAGQQIASCLIQNTGVSVGQVMSLFGFVWDPARNSGLGGVVPFSSIDHFEIITGGSLQNTYMTPQQMQDQQRSLYGWGTSTMPSGTFTFDYTLSEDGGYLSNANAINTYLVNGVQLNVYFKAGNIPSATSTVYMGIEALKLATS